MDKLKNINSGNGYSSNQAMGELNWAGVKSFSPSTNPVLQNNFQNTIQNTRGIQPNQNSGKNQAPFPNKIPNQGANGQGGVQSSVKLPKFLNQAPNSAGNNYLPGQVLPPANNNSQGGNFSQTFSRDNVYEAGVQRVFRKSIIFLGFNLLSFGLLVFSGINFFSQNYWLILVSAIAYSALTNLFYIIVADRNYVWFGLLAQLTLIISIFSFYGLGFNPVTIIFAVVISLMSFLAYSELEKVQLSSRLFSIAHLTNESTRILSTVSILVLSVGVYNGILYNSTPAFFSKYIWRNNLLQSHIFQGVNPAYSLNRIMIGGRYEVQGDKVFKLSGNKSEEFTFADFLEQNYRNDQPVITPPESQEIIRNCTQSEQDCKKLVDQEILNRLANFKAAPDSPYKDLPYGIETKIDSQKFLQITERYYLSRIIYFELDKQDLSFIPSQFVSTVENYSIPRKNIIPAIIAILVFSLLLVFKFALHWIIFIVTWLTWKILLWIGFAQIDIENVEAEIVNI
jgi:hypothetical protein